GKWAILPAGRYGDGSAPVVFLASIRCSVWGRSGPHAAVSMLTSRRMSARPRSVRGPWQIGHTAGTISAAPQEIAGAAQLQSWMVAGDIGGGCEIMSEHFWIDGGRMRGRVRDRLAWSRPDRAACNRGKAVPLPSVAFDPLRFRLGSSPHRWQ